MVSCAKELSRQKQIDMTRHQESVSPSKQGRKSSRFTPKTNDRKQSSLRVSKNVANKKGHCLERKERLYCASVTMA